MRARDRWIDGRCDRLAELRLRQQGEHEGGGHRGAEHPRERAQRGDRGAGLLRAREPGHSLEGGVLRLSRQRADGTGARRRAVDDAQRRGAEDRARQGAVRSEGRRPGLQLRDPLPLPRPRGRIARVFHTYQPRRRRRTPRDLAGDEGLHRRGASGRFRRLHLGSVREAPPVHQRGRAQGRRLAGDDGRSFQDRGAPRSVRPGRIRGGPGRQGREPLGRRGRRRAERHRQHEGEAAEQLHLPVGPDRQVRPDQGRHVAGVAGHLALERQADRLRRRLSDRLGHHLARSRRPAHLRQDLQDGVGHGP